MFILDINKGQKQQNWVSRPFLSWAPRGGCFTRGVYKGKYQIYVKLCFETLDFNQEGDKSQKLKILLSRTVSFMLLAFISYSFDCWLEQGLELLLDKNLILSLLPCLSSVILYVIPRLVGDKRRSQGCIFRPVLITICDQVKFSIRQVKARVRLSRASALVSLWFLRFP